MVLMCMVAAGAGTVRGDVLGTAVFSGNPSIFGQFPTTVFTRLAIGDSQGCSAGTSCTEIFSRTISNADLGTTFVVNAADNPDFAAIVALLTDGTNDEIGMGNSQTGNVAEGGFVYTEEDAFFAGHGGPDFAGGVITDLRITLTSVNIFVTLVPGGDVFGPGTEADYSYTVAVEGTGLSVPEPASLVLLGSVLLCMFWFRWRAPTCGAKAAS